jgi:hypothetical protein
MKQLTLKKLEELVLNKINEVKEQEKIKGVENCHVIRNKLRKELLDLIPNTFVFFPTGGYVVQVLYNPKLAKKYVAIFTKESVKKILPEGVEIN